MRLTEEREIIPATTLDGKETRVTYIHIEDKTLAEKKLFELENIEDELGVDLVTLFKASKNGMFVRGINTAIICGINLKRKRFESRCFNDYGREELISYYFEDYGKTWALTKEELL